MQLQCAVLSKIDRQMQVYTQTIPSRLLSALHVTQKREMHPWISLVDTWHHLHIYIYQSFSWCTMWTRLFKDTWNNFQNNTCSKRLVLKASAHFVSYVIVSISGLLEYHMNVTHVLLFAQCIYIVSPTSSLFRHNYGCMKNTLNCFFLLHHLFLSCCALTRFK
jgi:hypothetical protein